jgi:hypothetical protein
MTDQEVIGKYRDMALEHMDEGKASRLVEMVWNLDRVKDVRELINGMVFQGR